MSLKSTGQIVILQSKPINNLFLRMFVENNDIFPHYYQGTIVVYLSYIY